MAQTPLNSKPLIVFPFRGYESNEKLQWYFWWTVKQCKEIDPKPIVVIPRMTVLNGDAKSFMKDKRSKDLEILQTWSVDTCQTWLAGWGHILDNYPDAERIVQLPGDIDYVNEDVEFYDNLKEFIANTDSCLAIGDFGTGDKFSAKSLVDTYGAYPLLANWFPEVSQGIRKLPLHRPRSEFINIKTDILRDHLVHNRSFAYEQTLNFLIKFWDFQKAQWKCHISVFPLGSLSDNKSVRDYRSCIDQIERIERMISLLWREIKEPVRREDMTSREIEELYTLFTNEYDHLRTKSKGVMETARTTLRAHLGM